MENKIINLEHEKNIFVKKQRKIERVTKQFKEIRDNKIKLNAPDSQLYNDVYCEISIYRTPKKIDIKGDYWFCPTCDLPINNHAGYVHYCDFCGQALITPKNELWED